VDNPRQVDRSKAAARPQIKSADLMPDMSGIDASRLGDPSAHCVGWMKFGLRPVLGRGAPLSCRGKAAMEPPTQGNQAKDMKMAIERTFSMIKPDATRRNLTGAITKMLEDAGLRVVASKRVWMSRREAEGFYAVHKDRPFFGELVEFMSSAPTIVQVLEGENAIAKNREVMGATNPANAAEGTIRKVHALSIGENSVHGSDAPETAKEEIAYWFSGTEIVG
jgi:nucleoside-diphosphate kinase